MANILPWLFWCTSAAVSSLASADLLLLDRQKKWIGDRATDFWDWLDDQRELKYLPYLHKFEWQRFVVMLYAVLALLAVLFIGILIYMGAFEAIKDDPRTPQNFPYFLLGSYTGGFLTALFMIRSVLPRVLNWVTKTEGSWAYIGRSTAVAVATIVFYYATEAVDSLWISESTFDPVNAQESFAKAFSFSYAIDAAVYGAYAVSTCTLVLVMLLSWVLVVFPVILVLLLMILFRTVQFFVVRVAENPKGPQYALSVVLAAVGAGVSYLT
jgi:hypothetical protein